MADENQNAEMEDILSSIKNILEEDGNSQPVADIPPVETDVVDDLLSTMPEVDDILELSPDMRIEQTTEQTAEAESVDVSLPEIENDIANSLNIGIEDETSDSVFDEALDGSAEIEQPLGMDFEQIPEIEPVVETSDAKDENNNFGIDVPVIAEQELPADLKEISAQENSGSAESDIVLSPAAFENTEILPAEQIETAPVIETELAPASVAFPVEEQVAEVVADEVPAEEPVTEAIADEIIEEAPVETAVEEFVKEAPVIEETAEQPAYTLNTVKETPKADAADVSAGIISNFAKMFAREEPAAPAPVQDETVKITAAGNTGKTLEEFVLEAISKVIGQEISRQWNDGAAFKALAEAEINRQTREWINDNLPALVEKVVKQEIERVIAKVGS